MLKVCSLLDDNSLKCYGIYHENVLCVPRKLITKINVGNVSYKRDVYIYIGAWMCFKMGYKGPRDYREEMGIYSWSGKMLQYIPGRLP